MATRNEQTSLKVDDEEDEFQFKDSFPGFSDAPVNDEEHEKLLPSYDDERPEKVSFWEFRYYQNLFNVDTKQVMERIIWSAVPRPGEATYLHRLIRPNPDLYGPFWICVTLIFTIAVSSNIAEYLQSLGTEKAVTVYDYKKVTFTATTLFSYTLLLPLAVWGFLWYFESAAQLTILEIICIYGYSLAIYIPVSILWIVKIPWLQIILIFVGFLLSSSVMMLTFWPAVRDTRRKVSAVLLLVICLFHALLCFGFSVYFFQPQHLVKVSGVTENASPLHVATTKYNASENNKGANPSILPQNLYALNVLPLKVNDSLITSHGSVENNNVKKSSAPGENSIDLSANNKKSKADESKRESSKLPQLNESEGQTILPGRNSANLQDIQSS